MRNSTTISGRKTRCGLARFSRSERGTFPNQVAAVRKRHSRASLLVVCLLASSTVSAIGCAQIDCWGFVHPPAPRITTKFGPSTDRGQVWGACPECYGYYHTCWKMWPFCCLGSPLHGLNGGLGTTYVDDQPDQEGPAQGADRLSPPLPEADADGDVQGWPFPEAREPLPAPMPSD